MKLRFTLAISLTMLSFAVHAAIFNIAVTNNQFTPANISNVQIGDVIRFTFMQGFHNATSIGIPNSKPAGAPDLYSGSPSGTNPRTYDYTVAVAGTYLYGCEVHASLEDYSGMVGQFTVSSVLPAILADFKVTPSSKSKPSLTWKTLTEVNVSYFSIRSSTNGVDFTQVARVPATGNSTTEQSYSYSDDNLNDASRFVYYMLAVVDKDGKEAHSEIKLFKNMASAAQLVTDLSPNPVTGAGHLMFQFNAEKAGQLNAKVYNASGKMLIDQKMSAYPGLNNGHIHLGGLPSGTYSIAFMLDGVTDTRKVVIK